MKKYTIKEIVKAWTKFNQPTFYIKGNKEVDTRALEEGIIPTDNVNDVQRVEVDYSQWITYLILEEWKKPNK